MTTIAIRLTTRKPAETRNALLRSWVEISRWATTLHMLVGLLSLVFVVLIG